ncbi:hypothetical protein HK103_000595 [Boothiomyces macroporosus]|uniref:E3 ubiquitin ligase complex SCF subunit n=1 Tax=Boothiomyces macroporosus TaxID=261099 RepID=A0AAD5UMJ5_9FUNG|nr:hypothetical protein HK103_000595 [Boothiomyces macroporosus]KAJ3315304.1 hypothetical protein HDV04_003697 [Boothiomyces sp. JEL0838]
MASVKLTTSDDKEYTLDRELIFQSNLIKNMVTDLDVFDAPIPLPNVTSSTLDIVIKYLKIHKDDPPPPDKPIEKAVDDMIDEDKELMKLEFNIMADVILAANYLDIPGLLDIGCRTVAWHIKQCKDYHEIREKFNIPKELWRSEEEIAEMKKELNGILG